MKYDPELWDYWIIEKTNFRISILILHFPVKDEREHIKVRLALFAAGNMIPISYSDSIITWKLSQIY